MLMPKETSIPPQTLILQVVCTLLSREVLQQILCQPQLQPGLATVVTMAFQEVEYGLISIKKFIL